MEIFDVFTMNGIENNPAVGDFFLENFKHPTLYNMPPIISSVFKRSIKMCDFLSF